MIIFQSINFVFARLLCFTLDDGEDYRGVFYIWYHLAWGFSWIFVNYNLYSYFILTPLSLSITHNILVVNCMCVCVYVYFQLLFLFLLFLKDKIVFIYSQRVVKRNSHLFLVIVLHFSFEILFKILFWTWAKHKKKTFYFYKTDKDVEDKKERHEKKITIKQLKLYNFLVEKKCVHLTINIITLQHQSSKAGNL